MYQAKRRARSEFVPIRNLSYHVLVWGTPEIDKTPLVMLHGWMDVAASYQFVIDAFSEDHYIIAPDWRGYGQTSAGGADNFGFPTTWRTWTFYWTITQPSVPSTWLGTVWVGMSPCITAAYAPNESAV